MFLKFDVAFILFEFVLIFLNSVLPVSGALAFLRIFLLMFVNWAVKTCFSLWLRYPFSRCFWILRKK